jgi:hypothetical protein
LCARGLGVVVAFIAHDVASPAAGEGETESHDGSLSAGYHMLFGPAIALQIGRVRVTINTVERAAELLLSPRWPEGFRDSPKAVAARKACLAALEGTGTPDRARAAFLKAADEARMVVDERGPEL